MSPALEQTLKLSVTLLRRGSTFRRGATWAKLVTVKVPDGTIYIKETEESIHVSSPGYKNNWCMLLWMKREGRIEKGDTAEALRWLPYLERAAVLEMLADV